MTGVTFVETLRRGWRTVLFWSIAIGLTAILQVVIIPDVAALQQMAALLETMPPFLLQMFGGGDMEFLATAEGYIAMQYFGFMLVVFSAYGVVAGLNILSNDEERGTLDVVLSLPVARWQLVVERFLAYVVLATVLIALSFAFMLLGIAVTPALAVDLAPLFAANFAMVPPTILVMAITVFLTAALRRPIAIAIASALVLLSYFMDAIGRSLETQLGEVLRTISYYSYYDGTAVIQNGINWGNIGVLIVATAILFASGLFFFQRRDIGV
ncbi:MAG: ABC transporter permease subunit [Aggregatilineales bacterium]